MTHPNSERSRQNAPGRHAQNETSVPCIRALRTGSTMSDIYMLTSDDGDVLRNDPEAREKELQNVQFQSQQCDCPDRVTRLRFICGLVVTDRRFKLTVLGLIVINSVMMGIATFDFISDDPTANRIFVRIDMTFLIAFTTELAMNFIYHGLGLFRSTWLTFDFFVVTLSWLFAQVTVIRAFRCLRLITRIRSLQELVMALFNVIPRMFGVCLLLLLVFYVFAVMFTDLFKTYHDDGYTSEDYFSRLDVTCLTLFQVMTLDSWSTITRELMSGNVWAWVPMVVFVSISSFVFINLIIAVICDAVAELHHHEIEQEVIEHFQGSMEFGSKTAAAEEIQRLEKKVDDLTELVRILLQKQQQREEYHCEAPVHEQAQQFVPSSQLRDSSQT